MFSKMLLPCFVFAVAAVTASGQDLNSDLLRSAETGNTGSVEVLLSRGAKINAQNQKGETPLELAAAKGHVDTVKVLLAKGADINFKGFRTPLAAAVTAGQTAVAELLITSGADLKITDFMYNSPLHYAAEKGQESVVRALLAKGADPNARGHVGRTPLHDSAGAGQVATAELLIAAGADVNAIVNRAEGTFFSDLQGYTPLHFASSAGQARMIQLLLAKGADPKIKNATGKAAVEIAKDDKIAQLLGAAPKPEVKLMGKVGVVFRQVTSWGIGRWSDLTAEGLERGLLALLTKNTTTAAGKFEVIKVADVLAAQSQGIETVYSLDYAERAGGFKQTGLAEGTCTDISGSLKRIDQAPTATNWDNLSVEALCRDMQVTVNSPLKAFGRFAEYPLRNLVFEIQLSKAIPVLEIGGVRKVDAGSVGAGPKPPAFVPEPKDLDSYVGKYKAPLGIFSVIREKDKLMLEMSGFKGELQPESRDQFRGDNIVITFVRAQGGQVTHLVVKAFGKEASAPKIE